MEDIDGVRRWEVTISTFAKTKIEDAPVAVYFFRKKFDLLIKSVPNVILVRVTDYQTFMSKRFTAASKCGTTQMAKFEPHDHFKPVTSDQHSPSAHYGKFRGHLASIHIPQFTTQGGETGWSDTPNDRRVAVKRQGRDVLVFVLH